MQNQQSARPDADTPASAQQGSQSGADSDPGFRLPAGDKAAPSTAAGSAAPTRGDRGDRNGFSEARPEAKSAPSTANGQGGNGAASGTLEVAPAATQGAADTSTRDLAIGSTAFLILLVIFFFARNAYVHHLVVRRVAPSTAGNAGWLMFVGFCFLSAAAVLAIVNASKFLTFAVTGPLVAVGLVALVATVLVGRR